MTLGRILFNTNQDTKALKHFEIVLINASYIGSPIQEADALEYISYGYLRKGDYQNAYCAYEVAAEKFLGTIYPSSADRCKENMVRIERKQRNPDEIVGFHRPDLDMDSTLFYPPVQGICK